MQKIQLFFFRMYLHSWGQPHKPIIFVVVVVVLFLLCLSLIWKTNNFLVVQTCNLEFFKKDIEVLLGRCWAAVRKTSNLNWYEFISQSMGLKAFQSCFGTFKAYALNTYVHGVMIPYIHYPTILLREYSIHTPLEITMCLKNIAKMPKQNTFGP